MSRARTLRAWSFIVVAALLASPVVAGAQARGKKAKRARTSATVQVESPSANNAVPAEATAAAPVVTDAPTPDSAGPAPSASSQTSEGTSASASDSAPAAPAVDPIEPLRADLAGVMDDLVKARARVAMLGKALFKTKLHITLQNLALDAQRLGHLELVLDGAPIYRGDGSAITSDEATVLFDGFATPGDHTLALVAEQRAKQDEHFGYTIRCTACA
jgi:hypothetical protein